MKIPTIALFTGDPAGIGPELVAKVLAAPASLPVARIVVIGQRVGLAEAARAAGTTLELPVFDAGKPSETASAVTRLAWDGWDAPAFARGAANADNGGYMLAALNRADYERFGKLVREANIKLDE